jgi:hypothetical protein
VCPSHHPFCPNNIHVSYFPLSDKAARIYWAFNVLMACDKYCGRVIWDAKSSGTKTWSLSTKTVQYHRDGKAQRHKNLNIYGLYKSNFDLEEATKRHLKSRFVYWWCLVFLLFFLQFLHIIHKELEVLPYHVNVLTTWPWNNMLFPYCRNWYPYLFRLNF